MSNLAQTGAAPTLPEGYQERVARAQAAMEEGAKVPFPGPAAAALAPDEAQVLGRRLLPITMGHMLILQRIGSPLARVDGAASAVTTEEVLEAIYVVTRPPAILRQVLAQGREAFREAALTEVADGAPLTTDWAAVGDALGKHFAAQVATAVGYASPQADGCRSFPTPQPMDSAGACGSSAVTPGSSGNRRQP